MMYNVWCIPLAFENAAGITLSRPIPTFGRDAVRKVYMKRTQIYLPEDLHKELSFQARLQKTTISQLVRKSIEANLGSSKKPKMSFKEFVEKNQFSGGDPNLSKNIDYYLYDEPYK